MGKIYTSGFLPDGSPFHSEGCSTPSYSPSKHLDTSIPDGEMVIKGVQKGIAYTAMVTGPFLGPLGMIATRFLSHIDKVKIT